MVGDGEGMGGSDIGDADGRSANGRGLCAVSIRREGVACDRDDLGGTVGLAACDNLQ